MCVHTTQVVHSTHPLLEGWGYKYTCNYFCSSISIPHFQISCTDTVLFTNGASLHHRPVIPICLKTYQSWHTVCWHCSKICFAHTGELITATTTSISNNDSNTALVKAPYTKAHTFSSLLAEILDIRTVKSPWDIFRVNLPPAHNLARIFGSQLFPGCSNT